MKKFSIFVALLLAIILAVVLIWPILADPQSPGPPDATGQKTGPPPGSPPVIKQSHDGENLLLSESTALLLPTSSEAIEQLITNGGFEDEGGWTTSVMARTTNQVYSGTWSMGSYAAMDGSFYQAVSFPSDVISATLNYYWKNDPPDTSSTGCYDYQYTEIWDETLSTQIATGPAYCANDTEWHPLSLDFSPIITDVRGLTVNVKFLVMEDGAPPDAIFYFDEVSLNASVPDEPPPPPIGGKMDVCVPAESPPFAYINQPWDWVEGAVTPGSQVNATLTRGGSDIATASSTADAAGWFSFDFQSSGVHVDILAGDEVTLNGGGLGETITVVDIQGRIDVAADSVNGYASGGVFDVWGDVCVRQPFEPWFESKEAYFDAAGRFDVEFSGVTDIEYDYIAQVVYPDPNGNYVVQVFYPDGLDLSVLISEDRVEGVTTPGSEVSVWVWDDQGEKGSTLTTADDSGFFSTAIMVDGKKLDIELGDHVGVSKPGHSREAFVILSHESWLKPWIKRVEGIVQGVELLPAGNQGKVDLWSMAEEKWYSQYLWIENDGSYGADFEDLSEMTSADRIRLWVSDGDGIQQASFGSTLELGGSLGNADVWGHTIADSIVSVTLYRGLDNDGNPIDSLGDGGVRVGPSGDFSTTIMRNGLPVGISPGNIVEVEVSFEYSLETIEFSKLFFMGKVYITGDSENDILTVHGPANATVHVEGFRPQTTTSESYFWTQEGLDADGQVELDLSSHDLKDDDIFQIIAYLSDDGIAIESMMSLNMGGGEIFLPVITRQSSSY